MKTLLLAAALALSGCATIQQHPVATGVVIAVVAGSIAASAQHDYRQPVAQSHFCGCRTQ